MYESAISGAHCITIACLDYTLGAIAAEPGITDTEIKIGQTGPFSNPASVAAPQALV